MNNDVSRDGPAAPGDIGAPWSAEEALKWSARRNALLSETAARLLSTDDPQAIVGELCTEVLAFLNCDIFVNFLVDEREGRLHLNACAGIPEEAVGEIEWLDFGTAVCGCVARDGSRIVAEDIPNTPNPQTELVESYGILAYCCHPLLDRGRTIGTLSFGTRSRSHFSEADIEVMRTVAGLVAMAMARIEGERALRASEERLSTVLNSIAEGYYSLDAEWRFVAVNPITERWLGRSAAELRGANVWQVTGHPTDSLTYQEYHRAVREGQPVHFEAASRVHPDAWWEVHLYPRDGMLDVYFHDISERKRAESDLEAANCILRALGESSRAIARSETEAEFLQAACRIVVEDCGHAMVWVGLAEDDEDKSVRPVAYSGFEEGYLDTLKVTWADTERGRGPTGTAIRTGKPAGCADMLNDPDFAPWREEAIRRGYGSSLVLPLMAGDKAFGAITVYSREAYAFTETEVHLLSELADDISAGITGLRAREAQKRAEAEVHRARDEWERTFDAVPDLIAILDSEHRIVRANRAMSERLGATPEQAVGLHCYECVHGEDGPHSGCPHSAVLADGHEHVAEVHEERLGGDFLVSVTPMHDAEGNLTGCVHVARDITQRKAAEAELRRLVGEVQAQRDLLEAVATNATIGLVVYEGDGFLVRWHNREFSHILNQRFHDTDLRGLTPRDYMPEVQKDQADERLRHAVETGETRLDPELESAGWERGPIYMRRAIVPLPRLEGGPPRVLVVATDVTELVRTRQRAERRAAELDTIINSIADGIVIWAPDASPVRTNAAGAAALGFSAGQDQATLNERLSARAWRWPSNEPLAPTDSPIYRALKGETVAGFLQVTRDAQGENQWFTCSAAPLLNAAGEIQGAVTSFTDVSSNVKLQCEAEKLAAEAQQRAAELEAVLESIPDGLLAYGPDGEIARANPAAQEILGLPERPEGETVAERTVRLAARKLDDSPLLPEEVPLARAQRGEIVKGQELVLQPGTAQERHISVTAAPIRGTQDGNLGAVLTLRDTTELRRLQRQRERLLAQVESERARLFSILDQLPGYACLLTPDYEVAFCNEGFRKLAGEPEGRKCHDLIFGRTEPCEDCESFVCLETGAPYEWEWTAPTGGIYQVYDYPFQDADGAPLVLEVGIEVTDRVQAARERTRLIAQLEAERALLQAILEQMPAGLIVAETPSGAIVLANQQVYGLSGIELRPGDDLTKWVTVERFRADGTRYSPETLPIMRTINTGEVVVREEMTVVRGDGVRLALSVSSRPIFDASGNQVASVTTLHDLTDRVAAEQALAHHRDQLEEIVLQRTRELAEVNARLREQVRERTELAAQLRDAAQYTRSLIEANLDPLVTISDEGQITDVNQATERVTGRKREDLIGTDFSTYFTEPARARAGYERVFRDGHVSDYRLDILHRDGRAMPVFYNAALYLDNAGQPQGVVAAARDISERLSAEARLVGYQRSLQSLASDLALTEQRERHRIATIIHDNLAQLLAFIHMRLRRLQQPIPAEEREKGLEETRALIEEAISVARSTMADLSPPILYELGLIPAIEWLGEEFRRRHGIAVEVVATQASWPLRDDLRVTLFEAVRELLTNAAKHAGAESVQVTADLRDNALRIVVQDDGVGFSVADLEGIAREGTSFGLFSVRERLRHLGGGMEIMSQPGQGTRVVLTAPVEVAETGTKETIA